MAKPSQSSLSTTKANRFRIKYDREQRLHRRRRTSRSPAPEHLKLWWNPVVWRAVYDGVKYLFAHRDEICAFWDSMLRHRSRRVDSSLLHIRAQRAFRWGARCHFPHVTFAFA